MHLPQWKGKGLLFDVDGTLRKTKSGDIFPLSPDDVELLPSRREVLKKWLDEEYQLFFVSNQGGVASKKLTSDDAQACFNRREAPLFGDIEEQKKPQKPN
ncbi:MAG: hypothetical protein GY822_08980 [Deltaproteobacteria bacterium]|nr:hypothetical protein [Deltaproteobacteria bacterium]